MNGITASKTTALFCSMIIIFGLIVAIISFYAFSADIIKNQKFSLEPFIYGFGGVLVSVLSFLEMNRTACHVWIENGVLKTKGQFFGCYRECRIDSIKGVLSYKHPKGGFSFLYLIGDDFNHDSLKRGKYIALEKCDENIAFIRTFWQGDIV
ncbi:MAG: hypothetical protein IKK26_01045 [Clostridia bacterium]|nr:hypothetical protein [Clostridia bacterium]